MQSVKIPKIIIIGAGPGGLALYHALMKNKDKKKFDVNIFERESSPKDRWQGYHIALNSRGIRSLLNCIPSSTVSNLSKAIPDPLTDVEFHGITISDNTGNLLLKPPSKQVKDYNEIVKIPDDFSLIISYRDRLRDVLLEGVSVHWDKKCIGYEETNEGVKVVFDDGSQEFCDILVGADGINSPVRKQKIPELQIFDYGITHINTNIAVPKYLMDKFIKLHGNSLLHKSIGIHGDASLVTFRLIPIEQEQNYKNIKNKENCNETHYRATINFSYPANLDDVESDKIKVDDNDSASVVEHVKEIIRKLSPECETTDILLELWDLAPKVTPKDPEKYPFKTYNPTQRRNYRDINPSSVSPWKSSRVTLIGDAVHAMNPILGLGTNNAIQDADLLSQALINSSTEVLISSIQVYEKEMRKRATADVLKSRTVALKMSNPVGYFGFIIRNGSLKVVNFILNILNTFTK
ncbi:16072_t:CDS:2 [Funneliformis geosporum]|uniref:2731_t:CDS:1 n=1 Tax=Funneliformis geosporum TaxID=1117311 RepID=A0A9W4SJP5_9GLOM|nr:16072_t:CDS:2 [Funneliformis geosporum]CAI2171987.1 2731_t:CDS:2 [Funneliformis geosporum]